MLLSSTVCGLRIRKSRRVDFDPPHNFEIRSVRPSLTDSRFTADAWIVDQGDGTLTLRMGDYDLARITGLPLDVPSLNQLLDRIWNRRPKRRG